MREKDHLDTRQQAQKTEVEKEIDKIEKNENADEGKKKHSLLRELLSFIEIFVAAFILAQLMTRFVLINAEVPSESMENIIEPGDRLFGFRLAYKFDEPQRGDIVIFRYPVDESQNFIKRVIGLPGETVEISDGKIYINGSDAPLDEPYLKEEWTEDNNGYIFQVPEDCYLMLGDNRNISLDARFWAEQAILEGIAQTEEEAQQYTYVKEELILGRAVLKYYPHLKTLLNE